MDAAAAEGTFSGPDIRDSRQLEVKLEICDVCRYAVQDLPLMRWMLTVNGYALRGKVAVHWVQENGFSRV